jgi:hypothetical protein
VEGSAQQCLRDGWINGKVTTAYEAPSGIVETNEGGQDGPSPRRMRERVALSMLLLITAVLYLWNISINGMGNQF